MRKFVNLEDVPRRDRREILPFSLFSLDAESFRKIFADFEDDGKRGNWSRELRNRTSLKLEKTHRRRTMGRRVTKGRLPPPSRKLRSNRRGELAGVQSDFEFRVESVRVRVHRRSSHTSNPLSSVIRFNQPAPPRFDLYIYVCIKYNTYICIHV